MKIMITKFTMAQKKVKAKKVIRQKFLEIFVSLCNSTYHIIVYYYDKYLKNKKLDLKISYRNLSLIPY